MHQSRARRTGPFLTVLLAFALTGACNRASAQSEDGSPNDRGRARRRLKWKAEVKLGVRWSQDLAFKLKTPLPPQFLRPGEKWPWLRTPDQGTSFELQDVSFSAEMAFTPDITGKAKIRTIDLYNRNPTPLENRIFVREAWLRFGKESRTLRPIEGSSAYVKVGLAPRFTKQLERRFESYGLWGTAFGRLDMLQLQLGGTLGENVYFKAHVARRNPVFMRDPNALAGTNGTTDTSLLDPSVDTGFPILYDTFAPDLNSDAEAELGGGFGVRVVDPETRDGIDLMGWGFFGNLSDSTELRGTLYGGDLDILTVPGGDFPFAGDDKRELGINFHARYGALRIYLQFVNQGIAELGRRGVETEVAYRVRLGGLFVSGDQPVLNWLQLAFRFSNIDNDFAAPATSIVPSFAWDWRKYDFGVRLGIVRGVDLTVEYARHDMITAAGTLHPDEALMTLRVGM